MLSDPYVPAVPRHPDPNTISFVTSGGGGLAGDGTPQAIYPNGPDGGQEGTPYVNRLTGQVSWWYGNQWNP